MKRIAVAVLTLVLITSAEAQFKKKVITYNAFSRGDMRDISVFDTSFVEAFSFTTGFVSSAGTMKSSDFYKGSLNAIKSFNDSSYLDLWITVLGTKQNMIGLSYGKPLWEPAIDLNIFFNAGLLYSSSDSVANANWLGVPIGARLTYQFIPLIGLSGVVDLVPSVSLSPQNVQVEKVGITVMGSVGLIVTP